MKKLFSILSLLIPGVFIGQVTTTTLTSSGSFVVPCGVSSITVQCWGGGGSGGGAGAKNSSGGGGAGGAFSQSVIAVSVGSTINYTVGSGGSGSTGAGQAGGSTIFSGVIASGGAGGSNTTTNGTTAAGATGSSAGSAGTIVRAGGNGAGGVNTTTAGGGGGAAGTTAVGGNASGVTAGSGGASGGGAGGNGGASSIGSSGTVPGGGGGGGQTTTNTNKRGGDGGSGQIVISYSGSAVSNAGPDQTPSGCVTTATLAGNTVAGYSGYWTCTNNCGVTITTPTLSNSTVTGLIVNQPVTLHWTLTETATGCITTGDDVIITATNCPPSNDEPCSALTVTVNGTSSCTVQTGGTVLGATGSTLSLGSCSGTADDDVWFKFTATTTTMNIALNNLAGSTSDMYFSVHSGACGSLGAALLCSDPNSGTVTGLTVGSTYYIRVYTYTSSSGQTSTFSVCVTPPCSAPANDNACSATALTVNTSTNCTTQTAGTICGATASGQGLGSCFGTADDDVWYKFVATNTTQNISLNNLSGSTTDMYFMVYSGTCSSLGTAILCSDPESNTVTGLTVGNTYYIRLYTYTSTTGQTTTYSICVSSPCPAPANDDACSATLLTVNSSTNCTSQTAGTICGATASGQGLGACFGTADDDVWYKFVATNTTHNISINNINGSTSDMYFMVYGGTCSSLGTELLCSDPESNTVTGLTVGNTYYIRLYTYTSTSNQTSTFSVCVTSPCAAPANDNACSATLVTVNTGGACTLQTAGSVCGATASGQGLGSCFGTADDDVWFKFVATNATQYISLNNITGSTSDMYFMVYSGTCSSLGTAILCSDPESNTLTGLTVGSTYYIRVYTYTSTGGQTSTFSVCITPPCAAPSNDEPCSATTASVNAAATCTVTTPGTICGATTSTASIGACGGTADDDVWFKFTATSSNMSIALNNVTGSTTDLYHAVYWGTCGALGSEILCSDPNNSTLTGLIIGHTYYIRVYSYTSTSGQTSTFDLCIYPTPPPPSNVTCGQMSPFCSGSPIVFQAQSGGGYAAGGPNYGCLSTQPNPTWFYLQIATPGTMAIDLTANSDVDFALWGPYANLSAAQAACSSYPTPLDCSYSSSNIEQMNIANALVGEVYAVLVTNYANVVQQITLNQATGASATTNCAIVTLPIGLLSFNVDLNSNEEAEVNWVTETEENCDYFEVQRSADSYNWETIGTKKGQGTTTTKTTYKFLDKLPLGGYSYYRLKEVDFDKKTTLTGIATLDLTRVTEGITNLHPNPTNDFVTCDLYTKSKGDVDIELMDYTGHSVYSRTQFVEYGTTALTVNMDHLTSGVYLLKVTIQKTGKNVFYKIIKN